MAEVNILEIYISNGMGLMLMFGILVGNAIKMQSKVESRILYYMTTTLVICCLIDPIVFTLEGKPGRLVTFCLYLGNFLLYLANLAFSPAFLLLIEKFSLGRNSNILKRSIIVIDSFFFILLIINIFKPFIFYVDSNNNYHRLSWFFVYTALGMVFTFVGLFIYIITRIKGGVFKTFPVIELVFPIFLGLLIQGKIYGISLIWPATAVGFTIMIISIQNRKILMDSMTGLYNRQYLESFTAEDKKYCMMMVDLNGFKAINDNFGHSEGDVAIIKTAELLLSSVGSRGTAVRYAGDEFILLLNTDNTAIALECINNLRRNFEEYYSTDKKPYKITFSLGWGIFDLKNTNLDEILKTLDKRMYDNKREYYKDNDRRKR